MSKPIPSIGRLESFRRIKALDLDFLEFYRQIAKELGPVTKIYLPGPRYILYRPEHVRHVLKDNHANYAKSQDYKALHPMLGTGLLTAEGAQWKENRRRVAPEFTLEKVKKQADRITALAVETLGDWQSKARANQRFDLAHDMMALTFRIIGEALFGTNFADKEEKTGRAFTEASEAAVERMLALIKFPLFLPTPSNLKYKRAIRELDEVVYQVLKNRKEGTSDSIDFMSRLFQATRDGDSKYSDKDMRDELITMMLAGHETTALALTWTFYLLSENPDVAQRHQQELQRVLQGRAPKLEDLAQLPLNKMILQESMRLYPPAPAVSRIALKADVIDGYEIPAGVIVACVPAMTHEDPEFWPEPRKFIPERFAPTEKILPFTYYPFGGGPRVCIGEQFAMLESQLILATLAQNLQFKHDDNHKVIPQPLITLRAKTGMWGWLKSATA